MDGAWRATRASERNERRGGSPRQERPAEAAIAPILGLAETQRMPPAPVGSGATSADRGRR
jgi:hypothetical protein